MAGNVAYLSPEGLKEIIHTKNDMWACGVIFYWFIYGKMPFEKSSRSEVNDAILKKEIVFVKNSMRPHTSKEAVDLCQKLLTRDFYERLSLSETLKRHFFKKLIVTEDDNLVINEYFSKERF